MTNCIFDINEIIIIVMAMIEDIKNEDLYGIESDELNIPTTISEKIENLEEKDCEEFFGLIEIITNNVYKLKNGELHELNLIHREIIEYSNENLKKYIIE
ncbi:hypothetical protein [Paraclostridium bifermentans]|uniref:hypothetical protein n=1 Tax=Paraclostridium bifermentans TaxID=1490 RepID=UPI00359C936A